MVGPDDHGIFFADIIFPETEQGIVEQLHAELPSCLDRGVNSVGFGFTDEVRDGRGHDEQFIGSHHPFRFTGEECLRQDADDGDRELRTDLFLLLGGEYVDDSVDGPLGTGCMERTKDHVPRFGSGNGGRDRGQVSHFPDENHVGVHSQGSPQRFGEVRDIDPNFPLIDRRLFVLMVVLDRIFEGNNMVVGGIVQVVDHTGKTGGLTASRRTGDEEQTAGTHDQVTNDRW